MNRYCLRLAATRFDLRLFLLTSLLTLVPHVANATRCSFDMSVQQTGGVSDPINTVGESYNGTDICPLNPTAGCDFDVSDNVVRTHDIVVYKFAYNVLGGDADNVTISSTLPLGYVWDVLPGYCGAATGTGTPSSLSGDGIAAPSVMVCNIGSETSGAAVDLLFNVKVLGDRQDGDSFSVSGGLTAEDPDSDEHCDEKDLTEEVVITAAPRFNLQKRNYSYYPYTHNGQRGVRLVYKYRIGTVDTPLSGNASVDPSLPITWIDDVSGISPNAELISCLARRHGNGEPYRTLAIAPAGMEDRAVSDSGTLVCSQPGGAGTPINMTLTGADTTLSHYPDKTVNGNALAVTEKIAAVGRIYIFIPLAEVRDAPGGSLNVENCMTGFDPVSAAGTSNFGNLTESEHDNCTNMTVIAGGYGWSKYFRAGPNVYTPPTTAAATGAGDGVVSPSQTWSTLLAFRNRGIIDRPNVSYCDVIDINSYQFEPLPAGTSFQISDVVTLRHNGYTGGVVVEYASGYVGAWPPAAGATTAIRTECNDPSVVWNTSFAAAGGSAAVTKVRIRFTDDVTSGTYVYSWLNHKAIDNGNPNGHILENQATLFLEELPQGRSCGYNQGTYPGAHFGVGCGDRLMLTRELARIEKKTDDPAVVGIDDSVNSSVSGGQVKFWLLPSVTSVSTAAAPTTVTITDVLPQYMNFVSANPVPTSVVPNTPAAGQTTVTWNIPGFTPNTPIAPIELDVEIDLDAPPGVLGNEVCIESTNDGSEQRLRCDTRGINISVPAGLRVRKKVDLAYIDHDGQIQYELLWRNNSPTDITEMVIIDVLPTPGLGFNPTNDFAGSIELIDPAVNPGLPAGVSVEYSMTPGTSVQTDPTLASNQPGGSTLWCPGTPTAAAPAGCPTSFADVTAIRFTDTTVLPSFSPAKKIFFKIQTDGNLTGDLYRNIFGGKGKETTLPVRSNKVITVVLGVALGGIVFDDPENDGDLDVGAAVHAGIPVELYKAGDIPGTDVALATTTTDASGNYIFDFLEPGDYFVFIPESGFPPDRRSSFLGVAANAIGDDADDDDDQVDDGESVRFVPGHTDGVRSADINLTEHGEPLSEAAPNIATIHDDDRVNFTIDFGFTGLVALGNRIWNDDGAGGGGVNNGIMDGAEAPIDGVTVELYRAAIDTVGSPFKTTVTAAGGYYEFDRLRQNNYFVRIPPANFAPGGALEGLLSSSGAGGDDGLNEDINENGLDAMVAGGVNSANIDLRSATEAFGEDQTGYSGTLADENVDFTIDFGFVEPASVGSLVWDDSDGDGLQDPAEGGVPGVCVSLTSVGPDGISGNGDDYIVQSQVTGDGTVDVDGDGTIDPVGYYYFHNVMPADYYIQFGCLPPSGAWSPATSTGDPTNDSDSNFDGATPTFSLGAGDDDPTRDGGLYNPTTPVRFSHVSVEADRAVSRATFKFVTSMEDGTVGFNLYARKSGKWQRLNTELVPAIAADSGRDGARYERSVYEAYASEFAITEIDTYGNETVHGPYRAGVRYGHLQDDADAVATRSAKTHPASNAIYRKPSGQPVDSLWLLTRGDGIYRVSQQALAAAGLDLRSIDPSSIAITNRGRPVPRYVGGVGSAGDFGEGAYVEFLAQQVVSLHTNHNVYEISVDASRAQAVDTIASVDSVAASVARKTISIDKDRFYSRLAPVNDPWYMDRILATEHGRSKHYRFNVDRPAPGRGELTLKLWGATDDPLVDGDHSVQVYVNERLVAKRVFEGVSGATLKGRLPSGLLVAGENSIEVRLPHNRRAAFDLVYLDRIDIRYPTELELSEPTLTFSGARTSYRIKGIGSTNASVWSRSTTGIQRHELDIASGTGRISSDTAMRTYTIAAPRAIKTPVLAATAGLQESTAPAQYLVITHRAFNNAQLDRLVAQRQADGFSTDVVDVADVYGTYSGGVIDARAIKAFIVASARKRDTQMVLLVGDDTLDPLNRLGTNSKSYIPTLYGASDKTIKWAPSDALFADVDADGVQDLAIGRLPVTSSVELAAVVDKTLAYAETNRAGGVIMAADSTDDATLYSFARDSEKLIHMLGAGWSVRRAYLDKGKVSKVRNSVIEGINKGASIVSYMGHSDLNSWSFDGLLRGRDLARLSNKGLPVVALQWGCWNTYFVEPTKRVLGMDLLTQPETGAAAVIGASSLVRASSERELGREVFRRLGAGNLTIGELIAESKQALAKRYPNSMQDIQVNFNLLGDPALRIAAPDPRLELTPDVAVDGRFGTRFGDSNNDGSLTASFDSTGEDVLLSLKGFDIDDSREVDVYLNGRRIGSLLRGQNNRLNRGDMFLIRQEQQRDGTNLVEFRHRTPGRRWGITELALLSDNQPSIELGVNERASGEYGHRYGSDQNPANLKATFEGTPTDLLLSARGFDISTREVSVLLNGQLLGHLRETGAGRSAGRNEFFIPAWRQRASNTIEFRPRAVGRRWGVSKIRLVDVGGPELTLSLDNKSKGKYGYGFGRVEYAQSLVTRWIGKFRKLKLNLTGYDIGRREVRMYLNGHFIGFLQSTASGTQQPLRPVPLSTGYQVAGENRLEFRLSSARSRWGVKDLQLTSRVTHETEQFDPIVEDEIMLEELGISVDGG